MNGNLTFFFYVSLLVFYYSDVALYCCAIFSCYYLQRHTKVNLKINRNLEIIAWGLMKTLPSIEINFFTILNIFYSFNNIP